MPINKASWRRHLARSAVTATTPLDQLPPPHYGPGHNLPPPGSDLDAAMRRDINGYAIDFINQPRVDVDPNIGLSLMMGLSDTLTVRRLLTTEEMRQRGIELNGVDPTPPVRNVIDHIERERMAGKSHAVIMLRFPGVHRHGQHYNDSLKATDPTMIEMPVVIDIREQALGAGFDEEWISSQLSYGPDDIIGKSSGDKVAQVYGFANAQDMQNSRPLGLNNNWLRRNEHAGTGTEKAIKTLKTSLKKITKRLSTQERLRDCLVEKLTRLSNDGPDKDMLTAAERVTELRTKAQPILDAIAPLQERLDGLQASIAECNNEEEKKSLQQQAQSIKQDMHPLHLQLTPITCKINKALRNTAPVLEQSRQGQLATRNDEIARLEQLQAEGTLELTHLKNIEPTQHTYAPSDHNPTLFTMKVAAANPRDYKRIQDENPDALLAGSPKAVQEIYRNTIFPYALDNRPNGWLKDALGTSDDGKISDKPDYKPDNSYTRATRRYFMHLFEQAKEAGTPYKRFSEFAEDNASILGQAIDTLNKAATSDPALAANWRDTTRSNGAGHEIQ